MNGRICSGMCAAVVLATTVTVLAQDPASPQSSSKQGTSAKTVTVAGCVQRAQERATGTTGTTPSGTETKFVLTNASIKTDEPAGAAGTTPPATTAISNEYRLDADEAKLTAHVGHKVEITGTVEQPSPTEQKPPASAANAPKLKVDSVKMVALTCP